MQRTLSKRLCEQLGITRGDNLAVTVEREAIVLTPMRTVIGGVARSLCMERVLK